MAYMLLCALRRIGLADTRFATVNCGATRLKLLKNLPRTESGDAALVHISVRRVKLDMASGCPCRRAFQIAHARLFAARA